MKGMFYLRSAKCINDVIGRTVTSSFVNGLSIFIDHREHVLSRDFTTDFRKKSEVVLTIPKYTTVMTAHGIPQNATIGAIHVFDWLLRLPYTSEVSRV